MSDDFVQCHQNFMAPFLGVFLNERFWLLEKFLIALSLFDSEEGHYIDIYRKNISLE